MGNFKGFTPRQIFQSPIPVVSPCQLTPPEKALQLPVSSRRCLGSFGSVSCEQSAPLFWILLNAKFCSCKTGVSVSLRPPVAYNQILLALWPDSLDIPIPMPDAQAGKHSIGVQNLHKSGRSSLALLFSVCGSPTQLGVVDFYHD